MTGMYLIVDEEKFCTTIEFDTLDELLKSEKMIWLGVLVDKSISGSHRPDHSPIILNKADSTVRKVTVQDFEDYRISMPSLFQIGLSDAKN